MDEILKLIMELKNLTRASLSTSFPRARTYHAVDKLEKIAGWELAEFENKQKQEK